MNLYLIIALDDAAALLGCSSANLSLALTQRSVEVRGEKVKRDLSVNDVSIIAFHVYTKKQKTMLNHKRKLNHPMKLFVSLLEKVLIFLYRGCMQEMPCVKLCTAECFLGWLPELMTASK